MGWMALDLLSLQIASDGSVLALPALVLGMHMHSRNDGSWVYICAIWKWLLRVIASSSFLCLSD